MNTAECACVFHLLVHLKRNIQNTFSSPDIHISISTVFSSTKFARLINFEWFYFWNKKFASSKFVPVIWIFAYCGGFLIIIIVNQTNAHSTRISQNWQPSYGPVVIQCHRTISNLPTNKSTSKSYQFECDLTFFAITDWLLINGLKHLANRYTIQLRKTATKNP